MLAKLLKYEFKYTAKVMLLLYGIVAGVTALSSVMLFLLLKAELPSSQDYVLAFSFLAVTMYMLTLVAAYLIALIYLCVRFYRTMYSAQGYLTHTLPVAPTQTLHSKLISSFVWMLSTTLLLIVSFFILAFAATGGTLFTSGFPLFVAELRSMALSLGISLAQMAWYGVLAVILGCLQPLMVFASISIGQLSAHNKIAMSVVAGVVIRFVNQAISSLIGILYTIHIVTPYPVTSPSGSEMLSVANIYLVYNILLIATFYVVCRVIVQKHINLE